MPRSRQIPALFLLTLFLGLLPVPQLGGCDPPITNMRTELDDLEVIKTRLLIDFSESLFPEKPYGLRRLMYVENRKGSDPHLQPEQWALGFSGPLITAGPVSLRGVLAQLYNPLAHGPGSDVFSDATAVSLNIDLDVASRKGLQISLIPGHWNLFGLYADTVRVQLGSSVAVSVGPRGDGVVVAMLSAPPDRLAEEQTWYAEQPPYPGGVISHLAGSLTWKPEPLRLRLTTATSAGQWVGPGTFTTLHASRRIQQTDMDLLLGYCSLRYFTPEGDKGDLEWIFAARMKRGFGPVRFSLGWQKELPPLVPVPGPYRESRDRLNTGIEIIGRTDSGLAWSLEGDTGLEREWSRQGEGNTRCSLEAGSSLDWRIWSFDAGMNEQWGDDSKRIRDIFFLVGCDPSWGEARLKAGYRHGPDSGFHLAVTLETNGDGKRFYIRLESKDVLPPKTEDWLRLLTLRMGLEAKFQAQSKRQPQGKSRMR